VQIELARQIRRLTTAGVLPADSGEERLQKAAVTLNAVIISVLAFYWVGMYWVLGLRLSAAIPFTYQVLSIVGLAHFVLSKDVRLFRFSQLMAMLVLPFVLQWTLGGFVNASAVMLWALIAPLGAIVFQGAIHAGPWFGGYVALTVLSAFLDNRLSPAAPHIPSWVIMANFAMNISAMSGVAYYVVRYFALERQHVLEALQQQHRLLQEEQGRSEALLLNVLPEPIAKRLKRNPGTIADAFPVATVLFADVVDFTRMSASLTPAQVVTWLSDLFSLFDDLSNRYGLEKIKTVGDAYMAAAGVPTPGPDHVKSAAEMALEIQRRLASRTTPTGERLRMRIGIHTGPVVAGVIGSRKFIYDLWGDTVNTASRMESHGLAGAIQVTEAAYQQLRGEYEFQDRGSIPVKGKGEMRTYLLIGRKSAYSAPTMAPSASGDRRTWQSPIEKA
jgi:class 3 adenylate cyclase